MSLGPGPFQLSAWRPSSRSPCGGVKAGAPGGPAGPAHPPGRAGGPGGLKGWVEAQCVHARSEAGGLARVGETRRLWRGACAPERNSFYFKAFRAMSRNDDGSTSMT